ncbi:MAG: DUF1788 domain-containing protein [Acidobacteria bacterium]|nr:DUF1788 domain-containing protein [Acidobacteriota bacterium]
MSDDLEKAFSELRHCLSNENRLAPTHSDPFFNFVHDPGATFEVHRRLPRWRAALEKDGWSVLVQSLRELSWRVVDASGRWEDWLELEEAGSYEDGNKSMRDVLRDDPRTPSSHEARPGLARTLGPYLEDETPRRLLILTDAALLHPWFRVRTLENWFHDRIRCPTVLFYPGRRRGQYGLHFLGCYPENGNYRSTIVGGL